MERAKPLLSPRQREIFIASCSGKPIEILEEELNATVGAIKSTLKTVYLKLKATNNTHALYNAVRLGEVDVEEIPLTLTVKTADRLGEHIYRRFLPQERTGTET